MNCDPASGDGHYFVKNPVTGQWVCVKAGCGAMQ